jgi:dinuclear metal center YbgI/SA1388 family protein
MPSVAVVLAALAGSAPPDRAASWDPQGLQLGDPGSEADVVGVCHEVTDQVVEQADELDLLITYHPLLFRPVKRITAGSGPGGRAFRLLRQGVALGVVHTAWDMAPGGAADSLAKALGLVETSGLGAIASNPQVKLVTFVPPEAVEHVTSALFAAGAGRIGNYSACSFRSDGVGTFLPNNGARPFSGTLGSLSLEPEVRIEVLLSKELEEPVLAALRRSHPYEEPAFDLYDVRSNLGTIGRVADLSESIQLDRFVEGVSRALGDGVRWAGEPDRTIGRVAVLPGSGAGHIADAVAANADVFVTGDVSHHEAREALDLGMAIIDAGHAGSERPGISALVSVVAGIAPNIVDLTFDPSPWRAR